MHAPDVPTSGWWAAGPHPPAFAASALLEALADVRRPLHVVREGARGRVGVARGGEVSAAATDHPLLGTLPALWPEWLGDRSFQEAHGTRFAYVVGAMANGIATPELVVAAARAGGLGFYGAAGLDHDAVARGLDTIARELPQGAPWGANLIHSPAEPGLERRVADLYVARGVPRVSASAYMALTPAVVRVAFAGVHVRDGRLVRPHRVFAKVSRVEVARRFLQPPPAEILEQLVADGGLTRDEAALARALPVAEDVTVEADSGGHTDNQTLTALFPTMLALRDEIAAAMDHPRAIRVGAAGGLGTPSAVAAAFSLGAAFVLTGSVNQACVESGLSDAGRALLAQADLADVMMAPAADMFELGVELQVLRRGTMFGPRARKLYELYRRYDGVDAIPADERVQVEQRVFGATFDEVRAQTRAFWADRDPAQNERAARDPRHELALCCRWYLGLSSRWAIAGTPARRADFQIWCGPAMGAFNAWVKGSFLEPPEARHADQVAWNLLEGAAAITRAHQLRTFGVPVPGVAFHFAPRPLALA